ncbi:hypothetical protein J3A83DRAFT_4321225 [Scleroderma citrinum]
MMDTSVRDASGCKATPVAVQLSLLALSKISITILEDSMKTKAGAQWKVCMQHSRNCGTTHDDGDMYHKKWHYNEAQQCWEGNPVTSAKVDDVMASIKHKVSTEGCDCMHSSAMKKEYMDKILTWSMMTCPELESVLHFIGLVLTRSTSHGTLDFLPLLQQLGLFGLGMVITCRSITAY